MCLKTTTTTSMTYGVTNSFNYVEYNSRWMLIGVTGYVGMYIDSISWVFKNIDTGVTYTTPRKGGTGGGPFSWSVTPGTRITHIYITAGPYVNSIQFRLSNVALTQVFGWDSIGVKYDVDCTAKRIAGVKLGTGNFLNGLAFWLEPLL